MVFYIWLIKGWEYWFKFCESHLICYEKPFLAKQSKSKRRMYSKSHGSMHCSWHNAEAEIHKFQIPKSSYSVFCYHKFYSILEHRRTTGIICSMSPYFWLGLTISHCTFNILSTFPFHLCFSCWNPNNQKKRIIIPRKLAKPCLASSFVPLLSLHINQNPVDRLSNSTDLLKAKDAAVHSSFDPTNSHRETAALV